MRKVLAVAAAIVCGVVSVAHAEKIGEVSTVWNAVGPNDKIVVEAFDDPKIDGVTCYLSRATKGGVKGAVGLAEDPSDAAIACRQVAPIAFKDTFDPKGEDVFKKSTSWAFKTIQVVRMLDTKRNVLNYLVYSDKLIDGSPKNSLSVVPVPPGQGRVR